MNRRTFTQLLAFAPVAGSTPAVAITMDDFRWRSIPEPFAAEADEKLRGHLKDLRIALFVIGGEVHDPAGKKALAPWDRAGHWICNHTYSHRTVNGMGAADFEADILKCEEELSGFGNFRRLFRFPTLKEGNTAPTRDELRAFLKAHGYRNGYVTIDASDWYYDRRLVQRLVQEPAFDPVRFRQPYLDHIWDRAQYYDSLSRDVLGRSVPHTLLIHYNLLNTLFLGDLLSMFRQKGWRIVENVETAFADEVYRREPNIVPAGESLVWALAKETGRYEGRLRYPGEDDVYEKPKLDRLKL